MIGYHMKADAVLLALHTDTATSIYCNFYYLICISGLLFNTLLCVSQHSDEKMCVIDLEIYQSQTEMSRKLHKGDFICCVQRVGKMNIWLEERYEVGYLQHISCTPLHFMNKAFFLSAVSVTSLSDCFAMSC